MSHFSKKVNHVLFEMSYLFNQLLDYKMKYINEKTKKNNAIDMYHLLFLNFYKIFGVLHIEAKKGFS